MRSFVLGVFCVFLMFGCATKEKPMSVSEYMPTMGASKGGGVKTNGSYVAKVKVASAQKAYLDSGMHYKTGLESNVFAYSRWALPSNLLATRAIESGIEESGVFKSVIFASSQASSDFVVESSLIDFYQDFGGETSYAVMCIKVNIVSSSSGKLVSSRKFAYRQKCKTNDAVGGVGAFGEVLGLFASDLSEWIKVEFGTGKN